MRSYFVFNGKNSANYGYYIELYPDIIRPQRMTETVYIPGRSAPLLRDLKTYSTFERRYDVALKSIGPLQQYINLTLPIMFDGTDDGFYDLYDSYNTPNVVYKARVKNPIVFQNVLNKFGRAQLVFECLPQQYYTSSTASKNYLVLPLLGTTQQTGTILSEAWMTYSRPLIDIEYTAAPTNINIKIGDTLATATEMIINPVKHGDGVEHYYVDCDAQTAWYVTPDGDSLNGNAALTLNTDNKFPFVESNETFNVWAKTQSGSVDAVVITARWYWI